MYIYVCMKKKAFGQGAGVCMCARVWECGVREKMNSKPELKFLQF